MVDLDEAQLAKLARELVMNVRNYQNVFTDFGIDESDYQRIEKLDYFRKVKEQFALEWNAATSTEERVRIGSLAYVEQILPVITRRAMRPDSNLSSATDVGKLLMKAAGVGEPKSEKASAERFVITINLGGDTETFDKPIAVGVDDPTIKLINGENGHD